MSALPDQAAPVAELARGIWRVLAPNPSVMTGPGTNTYLVGGADLVAIDPGPDDEAHLDRIAEVGEGRIRYVVATHTHPDHAPGAGGLAERTGATVLGFDERDGFAPDGCLGDGDVVAGDGFRLRALHTPGHASNHLCYLLEERGILFSGDHIMGGSTVVIAPPDGDMAAYLGSLRRLLALDPPLAAIAPGHGPLMADPQAVIEGYLRHRLAREQAISAALRRRGRATIPELVVDVYTDVPEALHPIARYSVWAHLRKLAGEGSAESSDPDSVDGDWVSAT